MHIGTPNNINRSRDRDDAFSDLMRRPEGIRVCDIDPSPVCPHCHRWTALFEAKRDKRAEDPSWCWFNTSYIRKAAEDLGIKAYMLYSPDGQWQKIVVIHLDGMGRRDVLSQEDFIKRLEARQEEHSIAFGHITGRNK
jgi:hypothetical protein